MAKSESDYGSLLNSTVSFDAFPEVNFTEGLYIDYRAFDRKEITPRFEFGFGLSYTTFAYSDLRVKSAGNSTSALVNPSIAIAQGGHPELWDTLFEVTASITNTGDVAGLEVPQLYVSIPNAPVRQLRGFERVQLKPKETKTVTFPLTRRDLSIWDVVAQQWRLQAADYNVFVGASSRILHLNGTLTVE